MGNRILSIIIPVFNEKATVEEIIKRVMVAPALQYGKEIIVVDDGSSDGTGKMLENLREKSNFILLQHPKNLGKGAAIKTALKRATGDTVIIQDADLEYDPMDWPRLLKELDEPRTMVVYGSRNISPDKRGYPHHVLGINFLTFLANVLLGSRLTDVYTCYKLFRSSLIKTIPFESRGFEFEAEITARILKRGIAIKEVPIHYCPRRFKDGKKIRLLDGFIGIWTIIKYCK